MKYIAYGSNMVEEQMAYRCPNAKLIGTGQLPNHRLEFYLHATVERSRARGASVPVAVWEINEEDEQNLDYYEGFPKYYTKHKRKVLMDDGSQIEEKANWAQVADLRRLDDLLEQALEFFKGID